MYEKVSARDYNYYGPIFFEIILVGVGGTGGYLAQRLAKLLYALRETEGIQFSYTIVDGDKIEKKNLRRQPFIDADLHEPKANIIADRYSGVYDIPIFTSPHYIESKEDLHNLLLVTHEKIWSPNEYDYDHLPILIGCVDNHATRKIMHEFFESEETMIYIDTGIDGVNEKDETSGYSGHVVCGYRKCGKTILDPVGVVYPDILSDNESKLPTENCADTMLYQPQRMQTNEMAAVITLGYLNNILGSRKIYTHYTNFDARTNVSRSVFIEK